MNAITLDEAKRNLEHRIEQVIADAETNHCCDRQGTASCFFVAR